MTVGIGADDVQANKDTRAQIKREGERLSFSRLTLRNEQNLRAAAYFPSKIDTSRLHRRFDSVVSVSLLPRIPLCLCLSIYLLFFQRNVRMSGRMMEEKEEKGIRARACRSSRHRDEKRFDPWTRRGEETDSKKRV